MLAPIVTNKNSQNITDDQSEKDGELLPVRLRKDVEQDAAQQCHGSEDQVLRGAERRAAAAAAEGCRAHGEQGEADGGDDAGRDNRSDDLCPVFGEKSQKTFDSAADDDCAHDRAVAVSGPDIVADRDKGKADAHDDRQSGADAPQREQLDQCTDACDNHRALD